MSASPASAPGSPSWSAIAGWLLASRRVPSWSATAEWRALNRRCPSWASVVGWHPPSQRVTWDDVSAWKPSLDHLVEVSFVALTAKLKLWDLKLADLGGDPAREDWTAFRPLRLSREEDWSDWLAHLLQHARSGRFPARLFGSGVEAAERWGASSHSRELVAEDYRVDIVLRFPDGEWIQIEVKVGDLQLAKTPSTGEAARRHEDGHCRGEYLLLPEEDRAFWDSTRATLGDACKQVAVRTWEDVARALRASVAEANVEAAPWRVWAWTFLGAVEQRLLGFHSVPVSTLFTTYRATAKDLERLAFLESLEPS